VLKRQKSAEDAERAELRIKNLAIPWMRKRPDWQGTACPYFFGVPGVFSGNFSDASNQARARDQ
jgi:hypothetical protein